MTTISVNMQLYKTDTRSRVPLAAVRNTHGDVENFNQVQKSLGTGESFSVTASSFLYMYVDTPVDSMTLTVGALEVSIPNPSGSFCFPFACEVSLSIDADSVNTLDRLIKVWYS